MRNRLLIILLLLTFSLSLVSCSLGEQTYSSVLTDEMRLEITEKYKEQFDAELTIREFYGSFDDSYIFSTRHIRSGFLQVYNQPLYQYKLCVFSPQRDSKYFYKVLIYNKGLFYDFQGYLLDVGWYDIGCDDDAYEFTFNTPRAKKKLLSDDSLEKLYEIFKEKHPDSYIDTDEYTCKDTEIKICYLYTKKYYSDVYKGKELYVATKASNICHNIGGFNVIFAYTNLDDREEHKMVEKKYGDYIFIMESARSIILYNVDEVYSLDEAYEKNLLSDDVLKELEYLNKKY